MLELTLTGYEGVYDGQSHTVTAEPNYTENTTVNDVMDTLGGVVAEFLSNNMNGERITADEITEDYDIEEMHELIEQYVAFTRSMSRDPN